MCELSITGEDPRARSIDGDAITLSAAESIIHQTRTRRCSPFLPLSLPPPVSRGCLRKRCARNCRREKPRCVNRHEDVNEVEQEDRRSSGGGGGRGRRLIRRRRRLVVVQQHPIAAAEHVDADRRPAARQPAQPDPLLSDAGEAGSAESQRSSSMLHREGTPPGDGELPAQPGGADHPGDRQPGGHQHQGYVRARAVRRAEAARRDCPGTRQARDRHQTPVG